MRLSLTFKRPIHEVLTWPAWEIRLYANFLRHEPVVEERIEIALAQLSANYATVHRPEGADPARLSDYLMYRDVWDLRDLDQQILEDLE